MVWPSARAREVADDPYEFTLRRGASTVRAGGGRSTTSGERDEGLRIDDRTYACGCRMIRHEFHDGSVRIKTIRHDGKVLKDEHSGNHEA